jgi:hypothetical protein
MTRVDHTKKVAQVFEPPQTKTETNNDPVAKEERPLVDRSRRSPHVSHAHQINQLLSNIDVSIKLAPFSGKEAEASPSFVGDFSGLNDTEQKLSEEFALVKATLAQKENNYASVLTENSKLKSKIAELSQHVTISSSVADELTASLAAELDKTRAAYESVKFDNGQLKNKLLAAESKMHISEVDLSSQILKDYRQEVASLRVVLTDLTLEKENVLQENDTLKKKCIVLSDLTSELNDLKLDFGKLKAENDKLQEINDIVESDLKESAMKNKALTETVEGQFNESKELKSSKSELSRTIHDLKNDLEDQIDNISSIKLENKATLQKAMNRATMLEGELIEFRNLSGRMKGIAGSTDKAFIEIQTKLDKERDASQNYIAEIADLQNALELAIIDRELEAETLKLVTSEMQSYRDETEELKLEVELLKSGQINSVSTQRQVMDERLREALVKLRMLSDQRETELCLRIEMLELEASNSESRASELEKLKRNAEVANTKIDYLKQQLEAALDSEEIIYSL